MEKKTGIPQSTLSSITNDSKGNAPSSDVIFRIKQSDPDFNINWLISGIGRMMLSYQNEHPVPIMTDSGNSYGDLVQELLKAHTELLKKMDEKITISIHDNSNKP
jgi:hypothetical protein